jgi:invasion protein IalB
LSFGEPAKVSTSDGKTVIDLSHRRCLTTGCFADIVLDEPKLSTLKSQSESATIKFHDGSEREVSMPMSPKGIASALAALTR